MAITSSSRLSNKDIEKTIADAEQFAAVRACGEANSLLSKFSTNKRYWISFYCLQDIETTHEKMSKATITHAWRPNNQIQHVNAGTRARERGEQMDTLWTAGVSYLRAGIGLWWMGESCEKWVLALLCSSDDHSTIEPWHKNVDS